eukprot:10120629-Lingulodinium_polyedra.AAC.1
MFGGRSRLPLRRRRVQRAGRATTGWVSWRSCGRRSRRWRCADGWSRACPPFGKEEYSPELLSQAASAVSVALPGIVYRTVLERAVEGRFKDRDFAG